MVGPSLSEAERDERRRAVKTGFVLLVGFSAGLVALSGEASLEIVVASIVGGLAVGFGLVWYLSRISPW
jgi:hypothetical protein